MMNFNKNYILEDAENIIEERRIKAQGIVLDYEQILNADPEYIKACNNRAKIVVQIAEKNFKNEDIGKLYDELKQAEVLVDKIEEKHNIF